MTFALSLLLFAQTAMASAALEFLPPSPKSELARLQDPQEVLQLIQTEDEISQALILLPELALYGHPDGSVAFGLTYEQFIHSHLMLVRFDNQAQATEEEVREALFEFALTNDYSQFNSTINTLMRNGNSTLRWILEREIKKLKKAAIRSSRSMANLSKVELTQVIFKIFATAKAFGIKPSQFMDAYSDWGHQKLPRLGAKGYYEEKKILPFEQGIRRTFEAVTARRLPSRRVVLDWGFFLEEGRHASRYQGDQVESRSGGATPMFRLVK